MCVVKNKTVQMVFVVKIDFRFQLPALSNFVVCEKKMRENSSPVEFYGRYI